MDGARRRRRRRPRASLDPGRAARVRRRRRRRRRQRGARRAVRRRRLADRATSSAAGSCRRRSRSSSTRQAYRRYLRDRPALVRFLVDASAATSTTTGSRTSHDPTTTTSRTRSPNHYQDISVRRVIAELVDDPDWPEVTDTERRDGRPGRPRHGRDAAPSRGPAASGAATLLQIRDPISPGYVLNPAVVPVHDPALITTLPDRDEWYHRRGLRAPLRRGVLADEQGHRGPLRPVPRARRRSRAAARRPVTGGRRPRHRRRTSDRTSSSARSASTSTSGATSSCPAVACSTWPGNGGGPGSRSGCCRASATTGPRCSARSSTATGSRRSPASSRPAVGVHRHRHPARPPAVHGPLRRGRLGRPSGCRPTRRRSSRRGARLHLVLVEGAIRELRRLAAGGLTGGLEVSGRLPGLPPLHRRAVRRHDDRRRHRVRGLAGRARGPGGGRHPRRSRTTRASWSS